MSVCGGVVAAEQIGVTASGDSAESQPWERGEKY